MQEASMLMAKLSYVEGDYSEAFNQYGKVTLDELALVGAPVYRLSMIAEAYATKGKSLGYHNALTLHQSGFFLAQKGA